MRSIIQRSVLKEHCTISRYFQTFEQFSKNARFFTHSAVDSTKRKKFIGSNWPISGKSFENCSNFAQNRFFDIRCVLCSTKSTIFENGLDLMKTWDDENDSNQSGGKNGEKSINLDNKLSHLDFDGKLNMVDIGSKSITHRIAEAQARVQLNNEIIDILEKNQLKKGDALTVAKIAGILAAKNTCHLIPLCHHVSLSHVSIDLSIDRQNMQILVKSRISCQAQTGAEMEALTSVCVAALTIYDMCKSLSHEISIFGVKLLRKSGGKSDFYSDHVT